MFLIHLVLDTLLRIVAAEHYR